MNEVLIRNWNETVSPDDDVIHLGDVALGPWEKWDSILTRLNGYKTLVIGNHDRIFTLEKEKMRNRFAEHYANWFDVITDEVNGFPVRVKGRTRFVNLSHFPYDGDSHGEDRYQEVRPEDTGRPLIHGHTHDANQWASLSSKGTPMFHVGVDAHNYRPVSEEVIAQWLTTI